MYERSSELILGYKIALERRLNYRVDYLSKCLIAACSLRLFADLQVERRSAARVHELRGLETFELDLNIILAQGIALKFVLEILHHRLGRVDLLLRGQIELNNRQMEHGRAGEVRAAQLLLGAGFEAIVVQESFTETDEAALNIWIVE